MNDFSEQLKSAEGREWLAMQYVLAELPDQQRVAFEDAMLDDVSLCEHVIQATLLTAGVTLACQAQANNKRPIVRQQHATSRISVYVAGIVLAGLLIVAATSQHDAPHQGFAQDESATVEAFVNLLDDDAADIVQADSIDEPALTASLADLDAPEWLLTAIDLEDGGSVAPPVDDLDAY